MRRLAPEAAAGDDAAGGESAPTTLGAFGDLDELATALATGELLDRRRGAEHGVLR